MKIRPARAKEAEAISRLLTDISRRYVLPDLSDEGGRFFLGDLSADKMSERMVSGFTFHVAEADGRLAGVAAMSSPTHLYYLFVDTPFQRQGLARRLLFEVTSAWRESGDREPLTVNASRYAVPAYRRLGFEPRGGWQEKHGVAYFPMQMADPDRMTAPPESFTR